MTTSHEYDLVILGGGAAAFAAITEADRRGLSTAIVNAGLPLGGTCVNVGCVPSKHLLEVGKTAFEPPRNPFDAVQYDPEEPEMDWGDAIDEKDTLVASLRDQNYTSVADHFGTAIYKGYGRFIDDTTILVKDRPDAGTEIVGERALVATGSSPRIIPFDGLDTVDYETSETILERRELPEKVVVIGGGYVGLEWSQILHHMGADVTILQRSGHILSGMDPRLGRELERTFEAEGISVVTDVNIREISPTSVSSDASDQVGVLVRTEVSGEPREFEGSDLFLATGVSPNTTDIGLDSIGIETAEAGAIRVDHTFQTTNPAIYAAGDCIGEPMLETVAAKEGNHVVRNAFGDEGIGINYREVPKVSTSQGVFS